MDFTRTADSGGTAQTGVGSSPTVTIPDMEPMAQFPV